MGLLKEYVIENLCLEKAERIQEIKIITYNKVNTEVIFVMLPLISSHYCKSSQASCAQSAYLKFLPWLKWT